MTPDDPRHGTHRGYNVGCRAQCCTHAQMVWMKRWRMGVTPKLIDPTGTIRRLQALHALGWSGREIGEKAGHSPEWSRHVMASERVTTTTADLIDRIYEDLSMTLPTGRGVTRTRRYAERQGWLPPLAWDDIDDPDEKPLRLYRPSRRKSEVDHAVIERVLAGERLHTTAAEKRIIVARWAAQGRSHKALCDQMGWHEKRYKDDLEVAS